MRLLGFVIASTLCLSAQAEISHQKICTREDAIAAETESSALKDWDSVYRSFKRFGHCDDGAISEGYSDSIGRLLAKDWKHFSRLNSLASVNKKFERFVIRHIDETIPAETLQTIVQNAHSKCPRDSKRLCKLLEAAAQ